VVGTFKRPLHGELAFPDRLRAMRRPGESFDYEFAGAAFVAS
jgi:hypothetical protein